ncbi:MAG: alpha-2-macroglobulin [Alphaproteobacteria bacterium]
MSKPVSTNKIKTFFSMLFSKVNLVHFFKSDFKGIFLNHKKKILSIFIFLVVAITGIVYYLLSPKAYMVSETAEKTVIDYGYVREPDNSYISSSKVTPNFVKISFPYSVAKSELVYNVVSQGATIFPDIRGEWRWIDDRNLAFTPEKDWIPNTKYSVSLSDDIFSPNVEVKKGAKEFSFSSPNFVARSQSSEFYEDPRDVKIKQVVATFSFNYPVDVESVKDSISIKTHSGDKYDFTYKLENNNSKLHVLSSPVKIKKDEDFAEIMLSGVKNAYNQEKIKDSVKVKVKIPSSSTFFKLNSVSSQIIRNELKNNEPEQVLFVSFSTSVDPKEFSQYVNFYQYNDYCSKIESKVKKAGLPSSVAGVTSLDVVPLATEAGKVHMFKYDIPKRNACVITYIKKGLGSVDGFIFSDDQIRMTSSSNYPMEASIAFQGSILSLNGDKTLTLSSQGIDTINVEVARIESNDLNHLISQTSGDFTNPYFRNYNFTEENISEIFRKKLTINTQHPAKQDYSSVNLNEYFKSKRGTFIVKVRGNYQNSYNTSEDRRLIVITDLAIMVKDNLNKSHDVFISSFSEGRPVADAKVEVLGKNGVAILTAYTNSAGMAKIPNFDDFRAEKSPTVYVVTKGSDISFMPVNRGDRKLDLSTFDVGGVYDSTNKKEMKAYGFSDRGIYRPNEKASFGVMLRNVDLLAPKKFPLSVSVMNSQGDEVASKKIITDEFGFADYEYKIPASAKIGDYRLTVHDVSGSYKNYLTDVSFRVEEFQPDTMKIKLALEGVKKKGWYIEKEIKGNVLLQNLYGNPSIDHNVKANFNLYPASFSFQEFKGYNFKDPKISGATRYYNEVLSEQTTDKEGKTEFKVDLDKFSRGTYNFTLNVEGFELEGGRSVYTSESALVSPATYIVGYKGDGALYNISKNAERSINFIAIDNNLNKIAKEDLSLKLVQIKYVPSLVEMPNGTYKYMQIEKEDVLNTSKISIPATGNNYVIDTKTSGKFYVEIADKEGVVLSKVSYDIAGGGNTDFMLDKDANLKVTLDKKQYNNGDMISMKIVAPYEGYGLITIERDEVYSYKWFKTSSKTTTEEIRLPYTVEGNAYINVAFVRDANSREIFMSPLAYSVVPFEINKDKRDIKIELDVPEVVKPGDELVVKYKTAKAGKIIVYGVNEGILQVAKYQTPDPLSEFIKKKALRVSSSQIMDLIMPDMKLLQLYKATGGDDEYSADELLAQQNPFARKQNEVVAFWSGVIDTSTDVQEYKYKVPAIFNGQIRVMAVAVSEEAMGSAQKSTYIRGDFALVPSGPFNVSPKDEFEVGVSIANLVENSGKGYEVKVTLDIEGGLEVAGEKVQTLRIDENGEKSVKYQIKALEQLGSSTLTYKVEAVSDASKNFEMPYHIGVRPSSPYITKLMMGYEPSKLKLKNFVTPMFEEYRNQEAIASTSPLVLSEGLIAFLDKFPHACTEQTISKIYPTMDIFFKYPELVKGIDVYALYDDTISKLMERQKSNGGFSAWSGSWSSVDEYASLYALDFMLFAKNKGFNVPNSLLNKSITYAKSVAGRDPNGLGDTKVAYAIYLLTKNGEVTTNYLINIEKYYEELNKPKGDNWKDALKFAVSSKDDWKSKISATYMAASYQMLKNEPKARGLIGAYKFKDNGDTTNAMYIDLMSKYFPEDLAEIDATAVKTLLKPLKEQRYNTNSAAFSLLALSNYKFDKKADKKIDFVGKSSTYKTFARTELSSEDKTFEAISPNPFFYVIEEQGFAKESAQKAASNFIEVTKEYINEKGSAVSKANVGDKLTVRIRFKATGGRDYINDVAIVDLMPGCFEIESGSIETNASLDYKEEREDRALIYVTASSEMSEATYNVKVIAKGKFVAPATYVEALYDTDVRANTKASTFTVQE